MFFHLAMVLLFSFACILFGLLRVNWNEEEKTNPCEGCQDDACEQFSLVGFASQKCDRFESIPHSE